MKILPIFSYYIAKKFLYGFALILSVILIVLLLSSSLEILRLFEGKTIGITSYIKLVFFKLPFLIEQIIPYIIFLSTIFTLVNLTKSNELIIARASGISVWQFLTPLISISIIIGIFIVTIFNPLSTILIGKFNKLSHHYSNKNHSNVTIGESGIWFTDKTLENNIIIHASSFNQKKATLNKANFYILDKYGKFHKRFDAEKAQLFDNKWLLENTNILNDRNIKLTIEKEINIPTLFKISYLQDNFSSPKEISFWDLFGFIKALKIAGFSGIKYYMHLYKLVILPLYLSSMVILASVFSLKSYSFKRSNLSIIIGIFFGFIIYFMFDVIAAFGLSGSLYPSISIFIPVFIVLLISISILMHLENG